MLASPPAQPLLPARTPRAPFAPRATRPEVTVSIGVHVCMNFLACMPICVYVYMPMCTCKCRYEHIVYTMMGIYIIYLQAHSACTHIKEYHMHPLVSGGETSIHTSHTSNTYVHLHLLACARRYAQNASMRQTREGVENFRILSCASVNLAFSYLSFAAVRKKPGQAHCAAHQAHHCCHRLTCVHKTGGT